ncbi:acyltransferase family protein [Acinetobacter sp. YH12069]|uniref:acyltransferase family protein n=1 Tax=Acinetobacter sp. YH12069 TaxID=2601065 RepID=UPI0015D43315|nr:acyltransferase family protein [Acinetobacter sp. YH12069]
MSQKFRYDINGLRAYAVALVVLFHFGVFGFAGGFIGVDVFFVISGFLMTSIIFKGLENRTFNFLKFYLSRANRIIPALFVLCSVVGLVGWFTLTPQELKDYAKHAITSLGFISNIQYFKEAGYFDAASHEKLLLHTWSLSVEWQFYILLPIFLFIVYRIKQNKNAIKIAFTGLFATSLMLAIYLTPKMATASFFLLPTRAWEMLAGGLIFLFFSKTSLTQKHSTLIELVGFGLITISVISFTGSTPWPSYNAILPVLGAFLILLASNQNSILTNNKIAQFLGNTSYSIYLWHWPLVFYLNYLEKTNNMLWIIGAILLSVTLGWLSYKYIENPSRKFLSNLSLIKGYAVTFLYIAIPVIIFTLIFIKNGIPQRFNGIPELQKIINAEFDKNPMRASCHINSGLKIPNCTYGKGDVGLIVIGDSHAESIVRSAEKALPNNKSVLHWTYSSCPTMSGLRRNDAQDFKCAEFIEYMLKSKDKYKGVPILIVNRLDVLDLEEKNNFFVPKDGILSNSKKSLSESYINTICEFSESNPVTIMRPIPIYKNVPKTMLHRAIIGNHERVSITLDDYFKYSKKAWEAQNIASKRCGITILNPLSKFCDSDKCFADIDNRPLYYDGHHLNIYGADKLIPLMKQIFEKN